jgi:hypothetical protein
MVVDDPHPRLSALPAGGDDPHGTAVFNGSTIARDGKQFATNRNRTLTEPG